MCIHSMQIQTKNTNPHMAARGERSLCKPVTGAIGAQNLLIATSAHLHHASKSFFGQHGAVQLGTRTLALQSRRRGPETKQRCARCITRFVVIVVTVVLDLQLEWDAPCRHFYISAWLAGLQRSHMGCNRKRSWFIEVEQVSWNK